MICIVTRYRIRNEEIRRRIGVQVDMLGRTERCALRWFGHVELMNNERIVKRVYVSQVEGRRGRGRPNSVCMDGLRKALNNKRVYL